MQCNKCCQAHQTSPHAQLQVLPSGEFNSKIPEPLHVYFESFVVAAVGLTVLA